MTTREPGWQEALSVLADELGASGGAVLFLGRPGRGKSTLAAELATRLRASPRGAALVSADPGQPSVGPPAAFAVDEPFALAFVGSTDPMAVRLTALGELLRLVDDLRAARPRAALVVDACGLVANAIGREWALRQAEAIRATHVVLVERERTAGEETSSPELELEAVASLFARRPGLALVRVRAAEDAAPGGPAARRKRRAEQLETWLASATQRSLALSDLPILGAPERGVALDDWRDRLVGLLDAAGRTLTVGVAVEVTDGALAFRAPDFAGEVAALRVGDAAWDEGEGTVTRRPFAEPERPRAPGAFSIREKPQVHVPPFAAPGDERSKRAPGFQVHLANGLFGDPLVHLRPIRERDAILLDLGRASSLPTKILHRVGLVLLSHAHVDHFFGFDELLRALLGSPRTVSLVGPPGIADRIASRIGGYTWNLIELDAGVGVMEAPRFRVTELRGEVAREVEIVPGAPVRELGERPAPGGLVHEGRTFTVRAVPLEHRNIASHAYAVIERPRLAVRPEAVAARGLSAGKWLDRLKHAVAEGDLDAAIEVEAGQVVAARELARDLLIDREGQKIVYVTDAADAPANRERIVALARGADLLICEATFVREDSDRARDTAHLPAFAAAEIAREANVGRLLPFHLSPRYEDRPEAIFRELLEVFPRVQVPREIAQKLGER